MSDSLEAGKPVSPKLEGLEGDIASSGNLILGLSFPATPSLAALGCP